MNLGKRNIRSAGRNSGSIELTLPVELSILEGIGCHLYLRDGIAPEIVLQPDLRGIMPVFEKMWNLLRLGFEKTGEIGNFAEADFCFGLFRASSLGTVPSITYTDGLAIHRNIGASGDAAQHMLEAFGRIIESMAAVAGSRLGLSNDFVARFGNLVSYLVSGETFGAHDAFTRSFATQSISELESVGRCRCAPLNRDDWRHAQNALKDAYSQFRTWNDDPAAFAKERELWHRVRRFKSHASPSTPAQPPLRTNKSKVYAERQSYGSNPYGDAAKHRLSVLVGCD